MTKLTTHPYKESNYVTALGLDYEKNIFSVLCGSGADSREDMAALRATSVWGRLHFESLLLLPNKMTGDHTIPS